MPFTPKYIKWVIGILILLVVFIAYRSFAGKSKSSNNPEDTCPGSFTIHPFGGLVSDAVSVSYSRNGDKYYSQASGGYGGYSAQLAPKEISKEAFLKACDQYKSQSIPQ